MPAASSLAGRTDLPGDAGRAVGLLALRDAAAQPDALEQVRYHHRQLEPLGSIRQAEAAANHDKQLSSQAVPA
jgi:hypothetical protein